MKAYLHLLTKTVSRKVGPYLITIFSILFIGSMTILMINSNNEGFLVGKTLESISTFDKFGPFLFATLFAAIIITHIFKEGEQDGSELIIVAKQITRKEILLVKFLLTLMILMVYQIIMFLSYIAISAFDTKTTWETRLNWSLSLFVGGIIVQLIASSIIILLAAVLSKVATIVLAILISALTPIISYTLSPLAKGQAFELDNTSVVSKLHSFNINNYDGSNFEATLNTDMPYNLVTSEVKYDDYQNGRWYDYAAYFDIWYQWGRFYSMFTNSNQNNFTLIKKWVKEDVMIDDLAQSFQINDQNYVYLVDKNVLFNNPNYNQVLGDLVNQSESLANDEDFLTRMQAETNFFNRLKLIYLALYENKDYALLPTYELSLLSPNAQTLIPIYQKLNEDINLNNATVIIEKEQIAAWGLYPDQSILANTIVPQDYISNDIVIIIWSVIGVFLIALSILIYARRDFK